jgi:hypothetical protein
MTGSERADFGAAMLLLATSLQQDLDTAQIGVYWHHLKRLPAWLRSATLTQASGMKWFKFPQPGQLTILADAILAEKRAQAAQVHLAACTHASRWVDTARGLERCPCHQMAMRAMDDVGARLAITSGDQPGMED